MSFGMAKKDANVKTKKSSKCMQEKELLHNVVIEKVTPEIDGGKFLAKAIVGEAVTVEADIFKDGHDILGASLKFKKKSDSDWVEVPMELFDNDRWRGVMIPKENTRYFYTIEAWMDPVRTWCQHMEKKCVAKAPIESDLAEGLELFERIRTASKGKNKVDYFIKIFRLAAGNHARLLEIIQALEFKEFMAACPLKDQKSVYEKTLELVVDRKRAQFSAWYELFPRSQGKDPSRSATFKDCMMRLPDIKKMGFDVIYLPPIHPIGIKNRKGPNNTLGADKNAPGSPWAIGNSEGGHKSIHPELGTLQEFKEFVSMANENDIEIALDIAYQCSPDHPYAKTRPEWFYHLPDGTIRYAENPPKKYEDIYPLNFNGTEQTAMWEEMESIILFWIRQGVKIFRIDNPHTKPFPFWQWMITRVQAKHPEAIFLAEAFTRPKVMRLLAKAGFTQSYTYFTWRNAKKEIQDYCEELTQTEMKDYFRGNFFANTPDILHEYLQKGGRPAFITRLVLAATLSSTYGIYSGFELCENRAKAVGSEEYLDSEKYQIKVWDWNRPGNIKDLVAKVNHIRRTNPALQQYKNLEFYKSKNENILCYGKRNPENNNIVVTVVNLDPFHIQEDLVTLPLWKFGIADGQSYRMHDLLSDAKFEWHGAHNYVRLDPAVLPAHIFLMRKG